MWYFDRGANTAVTATKAYAMTPMMADIIAVQSIYGTNVQTREGNTVYGANSNVTGYLGDVFGQMTGEDPASPLFDGSAVNVTLYDSNGIDTLGASFHNGARRTTLAAKSFSDIGGQIGNIGIMRGVRIENTIGGGEYDQIFGNSAVNDLKRRWGHDTITGDAGQDTIAGGVGNDNLSGGAEADEIDGSSGNDTVQGDQGNDIILAGDGADLTFGDGDNDFVQAGNQNDQAFGGEGRDTIYAGGDDLVGDGDDRFVFLGGANAIFGFDTGDCLEFRALALR